MVTSSRTEQRLQRVAARCSDDPARAILGLLHATQGVAVLALGNGFALPVTGSFMEGPPGSGLGESRVLFDVSFAVGVAAFLFISAIAHWLIASPWYFPRYRAGLVAGRNYARWVEYSSAHQ